MSLRIGVLMDPVESIKPYKDSTFAMILAAQSRGHRLFYFQQKNLAIIEGKPFVSLQHIEVVDNSDEYYRLDEPIKMSLADLDVVLMRKDPPFDMEYIYTTYILEMAEQLGTLIVNPPKALRQVNEKFFISYFSELTPKTLITRDIGEIKAFIKNVGRAVVKPLDGMGGKGIFRLTEGDDNVNTILESLGNGQKTLMVQSFLERVTKGDKRILLVDGTPPLHGLVRLPLENEFRANLAAGGRAVAESLTAKEKALCALIRPRIQQLGLVFVGIDVIDGYLTEINVTSPTCIREIEKETGENIAERLVFAIEKKIKKR